MPMLDTRQCTAREDGPGGEQGGIVGRTLGDAAALSLGVEGVAALLRGEAMGEVEGVIEGEPVCAACHVWMPLTHGMQTHAYPSTKG